MRLLYLEPAVDWTDHSVEERLRLCVELLFMHDLVNDRTYRQAIETIRERAARQRGLRDRQQLVGGEEASRRPSGQMLPDAIAAVRAAGSPAYAAPEHESPQRPVPRPLGAPPAV